MKCRNIPFGYQYENGIIIIHPEESKTVLRIFTAYMDGASLLDIANMLNRDEIEYQPGIIGWNKARLKRLLEDERYLGKSPYPAIIDEDMYTQTQQIKCGRNTQKAIDRTAGAFQLTVPILCESCGNSMRRVHDSRTTFGEKWVCRCSRVIKIADDTLLNAITECMNTAIDHPDIIKPPMAEKTELPIASRRLENEIGRSLEGVRFDKEELKKKIFECALLKFGELKTEHITQWIKAGFEKSSPLLSFNRELFDRTVTAVTLHDDKTVTIILKNEQKLRKDQTYANDADNPSENHTDYSTERESTQRKHQPIPSETSGGILPRIHQAGRTA